MRTLKDEDDNGADDQHGSKTCSTTKKTPLTSYTPPYANFTCGVVETASNAKQNDCTCPAEQPGIDKGEDYELTGKAEPHKPSQRANAVQAHSQESAEEGENQQEIPADAL